MMPAPRTSKAAGAQTPTDGEALRREAIGDGEKVQTESLAEAFGTPENGESRPGLDGARVHLQQHPQPQ